MHRLVCFLCIFWRTAVRRFRMKKGFTLVEVMIVVIVMGILAVVALPKLFGHIAKAKAAEVPIAAGT